MFKKPLIYDIDDAIFLTGKGAELQFKITSKKASAVIAGNNFLAEEAMKYCKNVYVVPTAVDTKRWFPAECKNENKKYSSEIFRIGWSGTSTSFNYLVPLQNELNKFLEDFPASKFYIMADRFPFELNLLNSRVNFIKWSPESEVDFVRSLNVGLMPIKDDRWSRGKCAYKMLLYAACGIPVVVSPIGVNKEILELANIGFGPSSNREWYDSLVELYGNRTLCKNLSLNAVKLVNDHYSVKVCAPKIEHILRKCV
jgi:glycosyltransferase involved in cell wall biosynthesis